MPGSTSISTASCSRQRVDVDLIDGDLAKRYLTNYPSGLPAGTYTFVGVHTLDGIAVLTRTKTITFS